MTCPEDNCERRFHQVEEAIVSIRKGLNATLELCIENNKGINRIESLILDQNKNSVLSGKQRGAILAAVISAATAILITLIQVLV